MTSNIYFDLNRSLLEIRILELQSSLLPSSQIYCSLSKAIVLEPPVYHALSYVWGDSTEKVSIWVNGKPFEVTKNLFAALKRLRRRTVSIFLWVDAICINQDNILERNSQVQLMKQIFMRAERVLIWLGESEDDSDFAMDLIKAWSPPGAETMEMAQLLKAIPKPFELRAWHAARRLFERPYWKRAWILQEIVFSAQATVLCGAKHVSWRDVGISQLAWSKLKGLPENAVLVHKNQLRMVQLTFYSSVAAILLHHSLLRSDNSEGILQLIYSTAESHATDPRDKIYALLGFREVEVLGLVPHYDKPVEKVYGEFVGAYLEEERKLGILCQAGAGWPKAEPHLCLPTWVPDFRASFAQLRSPRLSRFYASEDTIAAATISEDLQVLTARGVIYDVISDINAGYSERQKRIKNRWLDLALGQKGDHPTGIPRLQAYFRTVIADDSGFGYGRPGFKDSKNEKGFFDLAAGMMYMLGDMALKKDQSKFQAQIGSQTAEALLQQKDYVQHFVIWSQHEPKSLTKQAFLAPFLGDSESKSVSPIQWHEDGGQDRGRECVDLFLERQVFTCTKRSFVTTQKGYMGLASQGAQKDDLICVLLGCDKPLIIRKIENHYILVGDSYIYGMMNGEIIQEVRDGNVSFQDIIFQ